MITFNDLCERLKKEDEITIIELLDLSSEELVDILEWVIEDKQDKLLEYYNETSEELGE